MNPPRFRPAPELPPALLFPRASPLPDAPDHGCRWSLDVEFQPLAAQVRRVVEALDMLGQPLPAAARTRLDAGDRHRPTRPTPSGRSRRSLDPLCLIGVDDQPREPRQGRAGARPRRSLVQHGWRVFLVKVQNEAGVTAELRRREPQRRPALQAVDQQPRAEADDPRVGGPPALDGRRRCSATGR